MVAGDANEPDVGIKVILKLQGLIKTYFQTKAVFLLCNFVRQVSYYCTVFLLKTVNGCVK